MSAQTDRSLADNARVGLVLSGGGAKGAYQAGVVKWLAERGIEIDAVAGASVGALNGAVVASAPDLNEAAARLEMIWQGLAAEPPAELKLSEALPEVVLGMYFSLLLAQGQRSTLGELVAGVSRLIRGAEPVLFARESGATLYAILDLLNLRPTIARDAYLTNLLKRFVDEDALARGLPLYVSVFRSQGILCDLSWAAAGATGLWETPDSEFVHVQSLVGEEQRQAILASAALPLVFEAQTVLGHSRIDGGIGGWLRAQGNTPATPLLNDQGCKYLIVSHGADGSLWDRHAFPEAVVFEIRPGRPIARNGGIADTLGFDSSAIQSWIEQGYEDTARCLSAAITAIDTVAAGRKAQEQLEEAIASLRGSDSF